MNSDPHLNAKTFSWQPNAKLLLFVLLMTPLLISLGYWQLDRAQEKREILAEFKANQESQPVGFEQLDVGLNLQYRQVQFVGELDASRRVLLDNRVRNGRPGYEIFEVLTLDRATFLNLLEFLQKTTQSNLLFALVQIQHLPYLFLLMLVKLFRFC